MTHPTAQTRGHQPAQPSPGRPAAPPAPAPTPATTASAAAPAPAPADEIELDFIKSGGLTLAPELAAQAAPQRQRSDKQTAMDERCQVLHDAWEKAGKPSIWAKMVEGKAVATYFTEPQKSANLHKLIRRAADYLGYRVRWGTSFKATEVLIKKYNLPFEYLGREVVSFAIMDKRPRAANGSSATESK